MHPVHGCFETVLRSDKEADGKKTEDGELVVSHWINVFPLFVIGGDDGVTALQGHQSNKQGAGFNVIYSRFIHLYLVIILNSILKCS